MEDFRKEIVSAYQKLIDFKRAQVPKKASEWYLVGKIDALVLTLKFYDAHQKGDTQMANQAYNEIVKGDVDIEELNPKKDNSGLVETILGIAAALKTGKGKTIDTTKVNAHSFTNTVYEMHKEGKLPRTITVMRTKDQIHLVKKA